MDLLKLSGIMIFIYVFEYSFFYSSRSERKLKFRCKHANGIQNAYSPCFLSIVSVDKPTCRKNL